MKPEKGAIAVCGSGRLGVITSDEPAAAKYDTDARARVWEGFHLEPGWEGLPWCSRNPKVIGHVREVRPIFEGG